MMQTKTIRHALFGYGDKELAYLDSTLKMQANGGFFWEQKIVICGDISKTEITLHECFTPEKLKKITADLEEMIEESIGESIVSSIGG